MHACMLTVPGAEVQTYSRVLLMNSVEGLPDDIELHSPVGEKTTYNQLQVGQNLD